MLIRFVMALSAVNSIAVRAANMVLVLYALQLGSSPLTVGLIGATFALLPMLLSVPAGKLADRFGSRLPLLIGSVGSGLGLLVPWFFPGLTAMFVAAALIGLSLATIAPLQNLVGLISTPENRARNFSNFSLMMALANFLGPLIGGFSIDYAGHATACLYLASLSLVSVAMLVIWGRRLPADRGNVAHAAGGIRTMLKEPGVRRVLATSSLINVGRDLYQFYFPVYAHAAGLSASIIGMLLALNFAAEFVMRMALARLIALYTEERLLAYAFFVGAASLALIPFFDNVAMLAVISFVFGLGMGCGQPIITMLMFSYSPKGRTGEALGLRMTIIHFTKLVGPVAFGSIGTALGLSPMFWINALMMVTGGMLSRPRSKD